MPIKGQVQTSAIIKLIILSVIVLVVTLLHFMTPTEPHIYHQLHIIFRKLYFLPPVMAGAWFGLRGALITTLSISILFSLHAFLDWPGNYMEQANQLGELAGFWVVGLVPGYLFDRQKKLLIDVANANEETLIALVSALDLREHNTQMHSRRVREYALLIARQLGIDERRSVNIGFGALLHDVGKIAVPDHILLKQGRLTEDEWKEMRKHPEAGYGIIKKINFLKEAAEIAYTHHERFDGQGYPRGLRGEEIPYGARIFMVADVFDALSSTRSYHTASTYEECTKMIKEESGKHFDSKVVGAFLLIDRKQIEAIQTEYADG
ncbi:cyclic diguanylate phosphodiesterase [Geotalea daltonii FRC-32]|uniref:Cyclic diguanylate phosphodiesterase n=1 Tax=Geotalea daltonii (strain DSM 22248 / JCM 15807 / FRC-32) TaxID=316067 RepID=B9M091_GEODF|nr:HD domain-containing phosphohydrolase [Geotalea daltonii]ACM20871.1 cyclic diguanylate phosphodiesterase [Geotalea daltonii FRC-32]